MHSNTNISNTATTPNSRPFGSESQGQVNRDIIPSVTNRLTRQLFNSRNIGEVSPGLYRPLAPQTTTETVFSILNAEGERLEDIDAQRHTQNARAA